MKKQARVKNRMPLYIEGAVWLVVFSLGIKLTLPFLSHNAAAFFSAAAKNRTVGAFFISAELGAPQVSLPFSMQLACDNLYLPSGEHGVDYALPDFGDAQELPPKDTPPTTDLHKDATPETRPIHPITIASTDTPGALGKSNLKINNQTSYTDLDMPYLLARPLSFSYAKKKQKILIVHTHGSEAYSPPGATSYNPANNTRSQDPAQNVVAVGDTIATVLRAYGYEVIHDKTMQDVAGFNDAYPRTLESIKAHLKKNPEIQIVLDIHRDSMIAKDGTKYKPVADIKDRQAAQIMLVMGSDVNLQHEYFRENLKFALKIQDRLNSDYPTLARPMILSKQRYNQHMTRGSMIVEVGSCGNTLQEAKYGAELFANALAHVLEDM